jgi:hypothetical protein
MASPDRLSWPPFWLPSERMAVLGWFNVVNRIAQSLSSMVTGVLADKKLFWVACLSAGFLKVVYDLGLLVLFKNHEVSSGSLDGEDEKVIYLSQAFSKTMTTRI